MAKAGTLFTRPPHQLVLRLPDGTAAVVDGDLAQGIEIPADAEIEMIASEKPPPQGQLVELLVDGVPWPR
jgi:hypothetical protein